jgi:hypothetical protein
MPKRHGSTTLGLAITKLLWYRYRCLTLISLFNVVQLCAARKFTPFTGLNKVEIQTGIPLIPTGLPVSNMIAKTQLQIQDFVSHVSVKVYPVSHYSKTMV